MSYCKSFANRSILFSPCNDLCYSISKTQSPNMGSCMIHGGCVLLANDGICVVSDLNELKNDQLGELENVVQTDCVNIDVPRKYIEGCQQAQISVPVTCKIWACCETTKKQGARVHYNTYQNLQGYGQLSKTLIDYFNLVFVMTENELSDVFSESLIVQDILKQSTRLDQRETDRIPRNEFFEFLQYAASGNPSFSNEARDLIQGFYLASRRSRNSGGAEFPITALKSMMSLAKAHAKLSFRPEVSEDDAVMAILLYEESITARVGMLL
ncbi:probable DNA helicase MCM9 [Dendronephthya gigantea]|uniref:probable DNA helicase MCM9 n=1 Tax=Dendronephthya gigantea TaxID=151771 RepID=UPI00106D957A|nr:probable DNA helicase MCM9 [Dendronephthya gigantea]